ncbi:21207_t:CDS:2, partial [Dentiscutata erythropus]
DETNNQNDMGENIHEVNKDIKNIHKVNKDIKNIHEVNKGIEYIMILTTNTIIKCKDLRVLNPTISKTNLWQ